MRNHTKPMINKAENPPVTNMYRNRNAVNVYNPIDNNLSVMLFNYLSNTYVYFHTFLKETKDEQVIRRNRTKEKVPPGKRNYVMGSPTIHASKLTYSILNKNSPSVGRRGCFHSQLGPRVMHPFNIAHGIINAT